MIIFNASCFIYSHLQRSLTIISLFSQKYKIFFFKKALQKGNFQTCTAIESELMTNNYGDGMSSILLGLKRLIDLAQL